MRNQLYKILVAVLLGLLLILIVCSNNVELTCSYEVTRSKCHHGDTVSVSVTVTNSGRNFKFVGAAVDHFSQADLTLNGDVNGHSFSSIDTGTVTTDDTEYIFRRGSSKSYVYQFVIPDNARTGSYDLSFWVFGKQIILNDVIYVDE